MNVFKFRNTELLAISYLIIFGQRINYLYLSALNYTSRSVSSHLHQCSNAFPLLSHTWIFCCAMSSGSIDLMPLNVLQLLKHRELPDKFISPLVSLKCSQKRSLFPPPSTHINTVFVTLEMWELKLSTTHTCTIRLINTQRNTHARTATIEEALRDSKQSRGRVSVRVAVTIQQSVGRKCKILKFSCALN